MGFPVTENHFYARVVRTDNLVQALKQNTSLIDQMNMNQS